MKRNLLAAACGLAFAAFAGQASATSTISTPFDTPDYTVYLSGASAAQNGIGEIANQVFDMTKPFYVFIDDTAGSNYRGYFGVTKSGVISSGQKTVLLINRAKGGSIFGINPIARQENIQTLRVSSATCTLSSSFSISGLTATAYYTGCGTTGSDANPTDTTGRIPDFGVSDVAPYMFQNPYNVEPGASALSKAELAKLTSQSVYALMFGVAVTDSVPDSVNVSRNIYGQLLSGKVQSWSKIAGAGAGNVVVCRRVSGSGTQATYGWFFGGFPCTSGNIASSVNAPLAGESDSTSYGPYMGAGSGTSADPYIMDPTAGYTVIELGSSGDVRNCLKTANAGGTLNYSKYEVDQLSGVAQTNYYRVTFPAGSKAVGILSLDSAGKEDGWSFRALEGTGRLAKSLSTDTAAPAFTGTGVGPTHQNLLEGLYDLVGEGSYQYNTTAYNAFSTDKKQFITAFINAAGNPTTLDAISGVQGVKAAYSALPSKYTATINSATGLVSNNVARADRAGNQCGPLVRKY